MEGQSKNQIRIGLFLALGLAAALISILALGGDKSLFRSYIHLKAHLEEVQGLNKGSVVSLSGMTIGNISEIGFNNDRRTLIVNMKVDKHFEEMIPKDSTVEVRTQGALGDKYVYITPGTPGSPTVDDGATLAPNTTQDLIAMLTSGKDSKAMKIFDVIAEVNTLLKSINANDRTGKIMQNMAEATGDMKIITAEAKQLIGDFRKQDEGSLSSSMKKLNSILTKIDKGEGSLGALINDPSIHDQLKALLGGSPRKKYFQSILQNSIEQKDQK